MVYLSLQGQTLTGGEAMKQARLDQAKIQQGLTFTAQQAAIRASCLAKEEGAGVGQPPSQQEQQEAGQGNEKRLLSYPGWGLPEVIVKAYEERGVRTLFQWQVDCLETGQGRVLRQGCNLVYSAPTSGGKTLVAELLMLRSLIHAVGGGTALFVVPFISLAEEKAKYFRTVWAGLELGIKSFHSNAIDSTLSDDVHIAVCTIERANALVNRLLERGELGRLRAVVVDELHMIGDDHRGFLIEVMLGKVRMAASLPSPAQIQIIGLSATLPNLGQVAAWLGAHLFITSFRPVALELLLCNGKHLERLLPPPPATTGGALAKAPAPRWVPDRHLPEYLSDETQAVVHLCLENVQKREGVLVFCASRSWTERCAARVAEALALRVVPEQWEAKVRDGRQELLAKLRLTSVGLSPELEKNVGQGVAFHHAGLVMEERLLVEEGFKKGYVSVLVATSTLAAGVNLPASRVIVRSRKAFDGKEMSAVQFHQMCGRAGRFGIDKTGEAILMTYDKELKESRDFASRALPPMASALDRSVGGGVERAMLEVVMGKLAGGGDEEVWLETFARCTLYMAQAPDDDVALARFRQALTYLVEHRFIEGRPVTAVAKEKEEEEAAGAMKPAATAAGREGGVPAAPAVQARAQLTALRGTQLGEATFFSGMSPHDATVMLASLSKVAREGLILTSDLHLLYLVVPPNRKFFVPDWQDLNRRSQRWAPEVVAVAKAVGVTDLMLERLSCDGRPRMVGGEEAILRRFVYALILHDMLSEVPLLQLETQAVGRGTLQALRTEAKMFCGMQVVFSKHLKWTMLSHLIEGLTLRLEHGVAEELLPLFRVGPDIVHAHRARTLFNAGYKTHEDLATAVVPDLAKVLVASMPFEAEEGKGGGGGGGGGGHAGAARMAERIAELIVRKARALVRQDLTRATAAARG